MSLESGESGELAPGRSGESGELTADLSGQSGVSDHGRSGESAGSAAGRPGQRWRLLDDPVAIRALAHPLRHSIMSIIGRLGRATTADAARELGISHGLASHHLRQLAKYGFVEQVAGKDHRERPWRMVATSYNWVGARETAEGSSAVDVLEQFFAEQALDDFLDWQQRRASWPEAWRQAAGVGQSGVYLTLAELTELTGAFEALILRYVNERPIDDVASRPAGSVPVSFTLFTVPGAEPPPEPTEGS